MKYKTEEERREANREYYRKYRLEHRDAILENQRRYNEKPEAKEKKREWEANNRDKVRAKVKKWELENPEKIKAKGKRWYENNKEHALQVRNEYRKSKPGRASIMLGGYRHFDRKYGRETTITREWIVDHIFSSSCVYCGESDWRKLGCDRKDNSIGHTPENCIPACSECNSAKARYPFHQYIGSLWSIQGRLRQQGSAQTRLVSVPRSARIALGVFDQSSQDR